MGKFIGTSVNLAFRLTIKYERIKSNVTRHSHVRTERQIRREFEQRLEWRYREAFHRLDAYIVAARQAAIAHHDLRRMVAEEEDDHLYFVLVRIHARSCLVASEIRALIVSGHASGAMARWRTLHELAIVAMFIKQHGRELADRYIQHSTIMMLKFAEEYARSTERLGHEPLDERELCLLRDVRRDLLAQYGDPFKYDYGWASEALNDKKPTFEKIERSLNFEHLKPYQRLASQSVHAGVRGIEYDLGYGSFAPDGMLAGPSNAGLVEPAQSALLDFNMCTDTFLAYKPSPRSAIAIHTLNYMLEKCRDEFLRVDRQLKDEEAHERQSRSSPGTIDTNGK